MKKKKFDHAVSVNFQLLSDNEEPSKEEILAELAKRLEKGEVETEVFDTDLNEDEEE
jgi:hypothetical protein